MTNSLHTRFPDVAAQLDPALNDGLTADRVTATVPRLATWTCAYGHTWKMTIRARTRAVASGHGGCPHCYPHGASQRQLALASALAHALPGLTVDARPPAIRAGGRPRYVDITITELRLAMEYDGSYYHRERQAHDAEKSTALRQAGWQVVRLREAPLDRIDEHDLPVPVTQPIHADTLIPSILAHLRNVLDSASLETLERELSQPLSTGRQKWQWSSPPPLFLKGLAALESFIEREGQALPASEHVEEDFRLGRWVMRQRHLYRAGKLPQPEQQMLEAQPGWSWDWRETRWDMFIAALDTFATREGHLQVPQGHSEGDYPLGAKVASIRGEYRQGKLPAQRMDTLAAAPGWTWVPERQRRRHPAATQLEVF
ncbi:Helicase associated domain protein [Streptomyces sp. NPDC007988]|uniref:Helicase associated domain protein n=1 Tax=Streptomyces sp. NPDC007988 TaxID=3364802 RepID=UPI0036EF06C1